MPPFNGSARLFFLLIFLYLICLPYRAYAGGGFAGLMAGVTDSRDMDDTGNSVRLLFGPNITERLSLEFGLMDMGETTYDDPDVDFSNADDDNPPVFSNISHGDVISTVATDSSQSVATYTGFASARPQSFLITFRYRIPLTGDLDFFLKTGANIWWADFDTVEIKAYQDGSLSRRVVKTRQTSAIDQISGGGFIWQAWKGMSIRAELETTALDSQEFERARFQLVTLGVQYDF